MMVSGAASVPHRIPSFQRFMEHVCAGRKIKGGISRRRASDKSRVTPLYLSKAEDLKFRVSRLILDRRRRAKPAMVQFRQPISMETIFASM
jgi:hypothetical protein